MAVVSENRHVAMLDIAGSPWPVFKLEALAAGLIVFLIALVVGASMQIAVLGGAALATSAWVVGRLRTAGSRG